MAKCGVSCVYVEGLAMAGFDGVIFMVIIRAYNDRGSSSKLWRGCLGGGSGETREGLETADQDKSEKELKREDWWKISATADCS